MNAPSKKHAQRPRPVRRRNPAPRPSLASSLGPPAVWAGKLQRLVAERDQLLARQAQLMEKRARFFPDEQNQPGGMDWKSKELASTFDQLQKSSRHYAHLFDFAPVGYVVLDAKGQIQEINQTGTQLLGLGQASLVRQFLSGRVVREDISKFLEHLRRCKASRQIVSTELQLLQKAGPPRPVELVSAPIEHLGKHFTDYRTAIIDITQRRQTEAELQQVQQNYHALVDSIQGLVWEGRAQSDRWRFTFVSKHGEQLLGYPARRWLLESDFWEHRLHAEDRSGVLSARAQALAAGTDHVLEYRMIDAQRRVIWVRDSVTMTKDAGQWKLKGILINITPLKELEAALRKSNNELEERVQQRTADLASACAYLRREMSERKRLEHELLELTESVRRQQGVDVHGDVGQTLAGIAFMIQSLGSKLEKTAPMEANQAGRIQFLVDQTITRTHDPAQDLVSFGLQEQTLPLALKGLATRAESLFDVPCRFKPNGRMPSINQDVVTQFYNIAQEAVVAAVKYGEAGQVVIALTRKNGQLILTVQHNGHPFATPLHHSLDLGMKIMNYRAKLIGAALHVTEQDQQGPLVTCIFPMTVVGVSSQKPVVIITTDY